MFVCCDYTVAWSYEKMTPVIYYISYTTTILNHEIEAILSSLNHKIEAILSSLNDEIEAILSSLNHEIEAILSSLNHEKRQYYQH